MIVRIATEGQYELAEDNVNALNELDNEAVAACDSGDDERFRDTYAKLLTFVRSNGQPLSVDELAGSDVILPPPDITREEARAEFSGDGLIPG